MTTTAVPTQPVLSPVDTWAPPVGHQPSDISSTPAESSEWSPPTGHTQTNGRWTPFLTRKYDELEQWAERHQVDISFEELEDNDFGDYDPVVRGIRLDPRLTPRQVVSTLAHECAHAALGAFGGSWQHQEQRADEEATVMLVDPVAFASAMTRHQDAMDAMDAMDKAPGGRPGPKRDYRVAADMDVDPWVVRAAQRLWSSSVGDRLDRLTGWSVNEAAHRRSIEDLGWAADREQADALLEATYRRAVAVQLWSEMDDG